MIWYPLVDTVFRTLMYSVCFVWLGPFDACSLKLFVGWVQGNFCKQFAATGTCPYGPRCRFSHQLQSAISTTTQQTASPSRAQHPAAATTRSVISIKTTTADWSPLDDGIEVLLPASSTDKPASREEVNAYINNFLYGPPTTRKRLPIFEENCPTTSSEATRWVFSFFSTYTLCPCCFSLSNTL